MGELVENTLMKVNLSLSMKPEVIRLAKQLAKARGTSVSEMATQFIKSLSAAEKQHPHQKNPARQGRAAKRST
jgi:hypothetical protein